MIMRSWDPFTVLARLDNEFDELVRRSWGAQTGAPAVAARRTAGFVPAVDMHAEGADVMITLELPGLDAKDVNLEVAEGRLTISGERRDVREDKDDKGKVLVRELRYGSFRREFALPETVTPEDVTAHYDKGLLTVRVRNVTRPVAAPRKIEIQSGEAPESKTISAAGAPE